MSVVQYKQLLQVAEGLLAKLQLPVPTLAKYMTVKETLLSLPTPPLQDDPIAASKDSLLALNASAMAILKSHLLSALDPTNHPPPPIQPLDNLLAEYASKKRWLLERLEGLKVQQISFGPNETINPDEMVLNHSTNPHLAGTSLSQSILELKSKRVIEQFDKSSAELEEILDIVNCLQESTMKAAMTIHELEGKVQVLETEVADFHGENQKVESKLQYLQNLCNSVRLSKELSPGAFNMFSPGTPENRLFSIENTIQTLQAEVAAKTTKLAQLEQSNGQESTQLNQLKVQVQTLAQQAQKLIKKAFPHFSKLNSLEAKITSLIGDFNQQSTEKNAIKIEENANEPEESLKENWEPDLTLNHTRDFNQTITKKMAKVKVSRSTLS